MIEFDEAEKKREAELHQNRKTPSGGGNRSAEAFEEALTSEHAERGKFIIFCRTIKNIRTLKRISADWFGWADEVHSYEMHVQDRNGYSSFAADDSDCLRYFLWYADEAFTLMTLTA